MLALRDKRPVPLPRLSRWAGLGAFVAFVVIGLVLRLPNNPALVVPGTAIALVAGVPLFLRQSSLLLLYAVTATAGVALLVSDSSGSGNVGWFALCIVAGWCVLDGGIRVGAMYWAASMVLVGAEWLFVVHDPGWASWIAGVTLTALAASLVRHQLSLMDELTRTQAALIEHSRAEERNRIAHELHDIIAHSLTVSLLHISGARLALDDDPAEAARALAEAERLGRQSLAEVRATMGIAQGDKPSGIAPPAPGIDDLGRLVDQVSQAGVDVRVSVDPNLPALPGTVGTTVYRIVQEALTNAAKHAPRATVAVSAAARDGVLDVAVDSSGAPGHGSGMGLTSMRERAASVGGTCIAGPGGSGWLVHASLPLQPASASARRSARASESAPGMAASAPSAPGSESASAPGAESASASAPGAESASASAPAPAPGVASASGEDSG
jgi:signal transduction histidine kinase